MVRFDTSIFSPDTYHAAILAALHQGAANQDARYLNMLASMSGMGKKPIPDLQAGIVQHLPDVPFGYNNAHTQKIVETLHPPPAYQAPVTKVVETNAPPPSQTFREPLPQLQSRDTALGPGGGTGGDSGDGSSLTSAPPDSPSETPATLSPDETAATPTATPATQVATPTPTGFPTTPTGYLFGPPDFAAPPAPPSTPLNQPDFGVVVAPDDQNVSPDLAAPAPSINVDVNGNQVAAPTGMPSVNDPAGFAAAMAGIPGSGLLHSVNNSDMTNPDPSAFSVGMPSSVAVAVNQGNKGDSLNANAMTATPTTTVTVAPPDLNAPGFLAPGKSQQEAEQQNDDDTAAPSPGLLASVFDAVTGNPAANNPGNALAAMNAANQAQSEQAAANVAAMNANTAAMNDQAAQNAGPISVNSPSNAFSVSPGYAPGYNVAGEITGAPAVAAPVGFMGLGFLGDPSALAPDLSSANNMNANVAALMDTVNTDFTAPGFEQDASNNPAQDAISAALDQAAANSISQEAASPSPSAAPTGYSPGDMAAGFNTDAASVDAGPAGYGGITAGFGGFSGLGTGFGADVAGDAAAGAVASGFGGDTTGGSPAGDASGGFGGTVAGDATGGFGGVDAGGDSGGDAGGDGGGDGGGGW